MVRSIVVQDCRADHLTQRDILLCRVDVVFAAIIGALAANASRVAIGEADGDGAGRTLNDVA